MTSGQTGAMLSLAKFLRIASVTSVPHSNVGVLPDEVWTLPYPRHDSHPKDFYDARS
ncbi:hypothetical protein [Kozakia baliensis]|uniref:hypothetical protein n=1 Tax=Kozakia baliensis TaxID=153496 RepID=UPI00116BBFDE|nr:hypothetical protein [Kozakia baliensis]GEL64608.1 hypothetical protein KBA01_18940 [Kozakia baliensis]